MTERSKQAEGSWRAFPVHLYFLQNICVCICILCVCVCLKTQKGNEYRLIRSVKTSMIKIDKTTSKDSREKREKKKHGLLVSQCTQTVVEQIEGRTSEKHERKRIEKQRSKQSNKEHVLHTFALSRVSPPPPGPRTRRMGGGKRERTLRTCPSKPKYRPSQSNHPWQTHRQTIHPIGSIMHVHVHWSFLNRAIYIFLVLPHFLLCSLRRRLSLSFSHSLSPFSPAPNPPPPHLYWTITRLLT